MVKAFYFGLDLRDYKLVGWFYPGLAQWLDFLRDGRIIIAQTHWLCTQN